MAEVALVFKAFGFTEDALRNKIAEIPSVLRADISVCDLDARIEILCDEERSEECASEVYGVLKGSLYACEDMSLAQSVVERLALYKKKVSVAESLTGGLVTARLVDIPGASEVLTEGVVTYSDQSKIRRLGVNEYSIRSRGAVSREVAKQMAEGLIRTGVDYAVSTTGIAGPGGGTADKPVGLTFIGVADEMSVEATEFRFSGDRNEVRGAAANAALFLLWKKIVLPNDFDNMVIE